MLRVVLRPCRLLDQEGDTVHETPVTMDGGPLEARNQIMPLLVCMEEIEASQCDIDSRRDALTIYTRALFTNPAIKFRLVHMAACGGDLAKLFAKNFIFHDGNSLTVVLTDQPFDLRT